MDFLKTHLHPKENSAFFNPANIFLILGLFVGVLYSIFIPYGAGFDEETHQVRIMDIAFLNMLPNRSKNATITFREFYSLSYQRRNFNDPANDLFSPEKLQLNIKQRKYSARTDTVGLFTRHFFPPGLRCSRLLAVVPPACDPCPHSRTPGGTARLPCRGLFYDPAAPLWEVGLYCVSASANGHVPGSYTECVRYPAAFSVAA